MSLRRDYPPLGRDPLYRALWDLFSLAVLSGNAAWGAVF
jgi:hypothetical protein